MPKKVIFFHSEKIKFSLSRKNIISNRLLRTIKKEGADCEKINFIFCSDSFLLSLNKKYLHHDTLTDILTFDYSTDKKKISGEIFISIDRVKENAKKFKVAFSNELHRVMIHGILHLLGYKDKSKAKKTRMRQKEDYYLSLFFPSTNES